MEALIETLVSQPALHAKFLNTLSFMENCGAKKIARFEDPVFVTEEILDHAWEEKRHAYILKHQIRKLEALNLPDYRRESLLGKCYSKQYLNKLDVRICRYLKDFMQPDRIALRQAAYMLVTYAIEVRALELYPAYQKVLRRLSSPVSVHLIYREEERHLQQITKMIEQHFPEHASHLMQVVRGFEQNLFADWLQSLEEELN